MGFPLKKPGFRPKQEVNRSNQPIPRGRTMPFIEQLLFGVDIKEDNPVRSVLARYPGMGDHVADEVVRRSET